VIAAQPGTSSSAGAASLVRLFELLVELADRAVELPDDRDEVAGDPHLQLLIAPREPAADAFELRGAVEPAQRDLVGRVELVQMPTQPLLGAAVLVDEIVAVIDQQLQLAVDLFVRPRPAQVRLSDRGSGDRECVDRVRLAACAARAALRHSQLRRHPHQLRAGTKQLPFEPASQLSAVLNRPEALAIECSSPAEQLVAADWNHPLLERPACLVDGDCRHRSLVYVQPDHDHLHRLQAVGGDRRADRPQSRPRGHAPIRSHSTVSVGGGDTTLEGQTNKSTFGIESAAADRVSSSNRTPPPRRR
jgi:hypothetical protein